MTKDKHPQISVIVPVYKVEDYLRPCVDSILAQTWTDFELILVDDGSPDNCGAICEEYAAQDSRVRVIHRENGGLSAARNSGLEIAQGEAFAFIDSDDLIPENYLTRLWEAMQSAGADLSSCGMLRFHEDAELPRLDSGAEAQQEVTVISGREACLERFRKNQYLPLSACGKLFRSKLRSCLVFPEGRLHEDQWTIPIAFFQSERVAVVPEALYYYRVRSGSITTEPIRRGSFDNILGMDQVIRFYADQGDRELVKLAKKHRENTLASLTVQAKCRGFTDVPDSCGMRLPRAMRLVRRTVSEEKYQYYLGQIYPKLLHPYFRWQRAKSILHLK